MTTKIVAKYIDRGFGFPIVLEQVPMVQVRGKWTPAINYVQLAHAVLRHLAGLDGRLTGHQVRFVRLHFEMTLQAFAARFGVSHVAVLKWEQRGNKPTRTSGSLFISSSPDRRASFYNCTSSTSTSPRLARLASSSMQKRLQCDRPVYHQ